LRKETMKISEIVSLIEERNKFITFKQATEFTSHTQVVELDYLSFYTTCYGQGVGETFNFLAHQWICTLLRDESHVPIVQEKRVFVTVHGDPHESGSGYYLKTIPKIQKFVKWDAYDRHQQPDTVWFWSANGADNDVCWNGGSGDASSRFVLVTDLLPFFHEMIDPEPIDLSSS
jgi:hypothetical protein